MRKLMIAALSFSVGTALCHYGLPLHLMLWASAAALVLGGLSRLIKREKRQAFTIVFLSLACAFVYNFVYISAVEQSVKEWVAEERMVEAVVLEHCEPTARRWRIPVEVQGERTLKAMYYGGEELRELKAGDRLSGVMTVEDASRINDTPLTSFTAKGYFLMLYPKGEIQVCEGEGGIRFLPQRIAGRLMEQIDTAFDQRYAPFVRAILLGDRSTMTAGEESRLSEAGIYHITAVSGMHCGFLLAMLVFLMGRSRQRLLAGIAIPVLWLYVLITGCPASMIRAAVMLTFVLLGPLFRRENDPPTALAFALMLLLLHNPYAIAGVGLQLSFGAMAGLLLLTPRIYGWLPLKRNKVSRFIGYSLSASLGVMALTAPLTAGYFSSISLISPLANILTMPAASLTFALSVLALLLSLVFPWGGAMLRKAAGLGVWYITKTAALLARVPCHSVYFTNPYLPYWLVFTAVVFLFCGLTPKAGRKYLLAGVLSLVMLTLTMSLPIYQRQGKLHLVAVDVGQGAGAILASGGQRAVVDCGSSNSYIDAGDRMADALNTYGYFSLDYVILTHYHADHVSGVEVLLSRVDTKTILVPLPMEEDAYHETLTALAEEYDVEIRYITEDTTVQLGDATLQVFAPVGQGGGNEEGLSVLCSAGAYDALITGDMNRSNEKILAAEKQLPDLETLLVGHHGAANATSDELLEAATPEVGIISVGENSYGHPNGETMQRMVRRDMTIYRTDLQGNISLVVP